MERDPNALEARRSMSFGRLSSGGSSLRRHSFSLPSVILPTHANDDNESESVSEAGDIGDRVIERRISRNSSSFRSDSMVENNGTVFPIQETKSPLPTDALYPLGQEEEVLLPKSLEYFSYLIHLAVFGILGVLTRYLLQKLFGPGVGRVTSDHTILYLDLPSNMIGSFLMGWLGVVFKADISRVSDYLAVGLTTGYLGSLTTFSGWNQKMLDLSVNGNWLLSFLGFFIGLLLASHSIILGVETAKGFKWLVKPRQTDSNPQNKWRVDSLKRHLAAALVMTMILAVLLAMSGVWLIKEFNDGGGGPQLWLGCIVGPIGVWIRWFLARLNGRGLGKTESLKWFPFGTFIANVSAACIMAALATVKKAANTKTSDTIASGIQLGLMGCLSTVSTFIAEFDKMRQSKQPWQAYAYAVATMVASFGLGILMYNVPVWTQGYS